MVHVLECPYQPSNLVCGPKWEWISYMLVNIGVKDNPSVDKRVSQAVEKYIVEYVEDSERLGGLEITMGDLESMTHAFWSGYEQGLVDAGVLERRSDGG